MSGWDNPMFRKFNTLAGALTYTVLKGKVEELKTYSAVIPSAPTRQRARSASPVKQPRTGDRIKQKGASSDRDMVISV